MRPILLEFEGFGPYIKKQTVEFEQLDKNGIILISGETGAGKTTILDAICCALFGKASGSRGSLWDMRCKQANDDIKTRVSFVFEVANKRYKFEREIVKKRKNLIDSVNCMRYSDGEFIPLLSNPTATKINEEAEKIIGLSYEQFRQIIMLPQGEFETFLTSTSKYKQEVLEKLFNTEYIQRAIELVQERAKEQIDSLSVDKLEIDNFLNRYACEDIDAAESLIKSREKEIAESRKTLEKLKTDKGNKDKAYDEAIKIDAKFSNFDEAKKKLNILNSKKSEYDNKKSTLALYKEAAKLTPIYNRFDEKKKEFEDYKKSFEAENNLLKAKKKEEQEAEDKLKKHNELQETFEENAAEITLLNSKRKIYDEIEEKKRELNEIITAENVALVEVKAKETLFNATVSEHEKAEVLLSGATESFNNARRKYLANIKGILAKELNAGEPCPVCGSLTHPMPATAQDNDITEEKVNGLENAKAEAEKFEKGKRNALETARKNLDSANEGLRDILAEKASKKAIYDSLAKQTVEGIINLEQLNKRIKSLEKFNSAYTAKKEGLEALVKTANSEFSRLEGTVSSLRGQRDKAEKEANNAKIELEIKLKNSSFKDIETYKKYLADEETIEALSNEIKDYASDFKSATDDFKAKEKEIDGLTRPKLDDLNAEKQQAGNRIIELGSAIKTLENSLELLVNECEIIKEKKREYDREIVIAEENIEFARRLKGDRGLGTGLPRYILGVMLTHITIEANRLLKNVHGGRYQLIRTDESHNGSRLKGLELEVLDSYNSETRSVKTLSGGEKFLVSLCLAIGLTTVVQSKGNIKLGAMFVDEGFGTLDDNSIDNALDVLNGIKNNDVTVAVISHHSKLSNVISNKIKVTKSRNGSKLIY